AAEVTGIANICQRSADFFDFNGLAQAGHKGLFDPVDKQIGDSFFVGVIGILAAGKIVGFVLLPVVITHQRDDIDRVFATGGITLIKIIIKRQTISSGVFDASFHHRFEGGLIIITVGVE